MSAPQAASLRTLQLGTVVTIVLLSLAVTPAAHALTAGVSEGPARTVQVDGRARGTHVTRSGSIARFKP